MLLYQSPTALSRMFADEVLLAGSDRGEIDHLSGSARKAWDLLATPQTLDGLVNNLAEVYGTEASTIAADVEALVNDLLSRGWVEAVSDGDD
jgi:Coenzyme PQQ synthesis protein D (PqqD)